MRFQTETLPEIVPPRLRFLAQHGGERVEELGDAVVDRVRRGAPRSVDAAASRTSAARGRAYEPPAARFA
jgi:hypothetical protein